jgi:hypothetical protein
MRVDDFLKNVRSQEIITLESDVSMPGPAAQALLHSAYGVTLAEYMAHPDRHTERRIFSYGHLVGPGLSRAALDDWQDRHPDFRLPADLCDFLLEANGVHLWADLEEQRSYLGILPLADWSDAASARIAYVFDRPPRAALVISYQHDTAGFALLDTTGPTYLWCDLIDRPKPIGSTVEDLLEHWWTHCRLDPRQ